MDKDWFATSYTLTPYLRRGDLEYCINHVSEIIRNLPDSPYHQGFQLAFTNDDAEVAAQFEILLANSFDPSPSLPAGGERV